MKNIIADSLWAHMLLFTIIVVISLPTIKASPFIFICIGVAYFLVVIRSAMTIADFEMSFNGEVTCHIDKHAKEITGITIHRINNP